MKTLLFSGKSTARLARALFSGPRQLVTTGLSDKSAALMILLCIPILLVMSMITLPGFILDERYNEAYGFIARNLNHDLGDSMILALVAGLSLVSFMVPALGQEGFAEDARV
ncbi:MAG: hypothetical protein EOP88_25690 [Verrucomicrobiaceae bacterium]|nr:MAG: hypothetical protein EOP88_25690 [Verrucomicrobiaceae bacterium]